MKIDLRTVGDVKILDCRGKITLGEGTMSLRTTVRELVDGGSKKLLLNLAEISYIDSSGIGELVSSFASASNREAHLKLLKLTNKTQQLLAIAKLLTVFETFENEEAALASFQ
ncbi:MAG: STAS domain-containing protein [Acidobacteria bacterium]|nr:STAS domain-containing protein [Acidobacteriota bacterium]